MLFSVEHSECPFLKGCVCHFKTLLPTASVIKKKSLSFLFSLFILRMNAGEIYLECDVVMILNNFFPYESLLPVKTSESLVVKIIDKTMFFHKPDFILGY